MAALRASSSSLLLRPTLSTSYGLVPLGSDFARFQLMEISWKNSHWMCCYHKIGWLAHDACMTSCKPCGTLYYTHVKFEEKLLEVHTVSHDYCATFCGALMMSSKACTSAAQHHAKASQKHCTFSPQDIKWGYDLRLTLYSLLDFQNASKTAYQKVTASKQNSPRDRPEPSPGWQHEVTPGISSGASPGFSPGARRASARAWTGGEVQELDTNEDRRGFTQEKEQEMSEFFAGHPYFWDNVDWDLKNCSRKDRSIYLTELNKKVKANGEDQT